MTSATGATSALIRIGEAALLLGMSREQVRNRAEKGELAGVYVEGALRVTRASIAAMLATQATAGADVEIRSVRSSGRAQR